jgi:hypothetical protein
MIISNIRTGGGGGGGGSSSSSSSSSSTVTPHQKVMSKSAYLLQPMHCTCPPHLSG